MIPALTKPADGTGKLTVLSGCFGHQTAGKYGKFAGTVGGPENFDQLVQMGYTFISTGADVVALWKYYKEMVGNVSGRDIVEVAQDD